MKIKYSGIPFGSIVGSIEWHDGAVTANRPELSLAVKELAQMYESQGGLHHPILGVFRNLLKDPHSFDMLIHELFGKVVRTGDEIPERVIKDEDGNPIPDDAEF